MIQKKRVVSLLMILSTISGCSNGSFTTYDDTKPVSISSMNLTLNSPAENSNIGGQVTIQGTCSGVPLVLISGSGVKSSISVECHQGSYSATVDITEGSGSKQIVVAISAEDGTTQSVSQTFMRQDGTSTPPPPGSKVKITSPVANSSQGNGIVLSGVCEGTHNVDVSGDITFPVSSSCTNSTFSAIVAFSAGDGTKTLTVSQIGLNGQSGSSSINYIKDTVAPNANILSPAHNSSFSSPYTFALQGVCEVGLPVVITQTGVAERNVVCQPNGTFSVMITLVGAAGSKTSISALQADATGNSSSAGRDYYKSN